MDEGERIERVRLAHARSGAAVGENPQAHALMHVVVESQLAEGYAPAVAAYERFRASGVDRHNTIHALASVVAAHIMEMLQEQKPFDDAQAERDFAALDPANYKPPR